MREIETLREKERERHGERKKVREIETLREKERETWR